jgi:hypothetical protein
MELADDASERGHIRAHGRHRHHEALLRLKRQSGKVVKTTRELFEVLFPRERRCLFPCQLLHSKCGKRNLAVHRSERFEETQVIRHRPLAAS